MIRKEALDQAIESARWGSRIGMSPEMITAQARVGELWLGIADRLPVEEEMVVEEPVIPVAEGDEAAVTAICGHRITAWLVHGRWVHLDLTECDDPPVKGAER